MTLRWLIASVHLVALAIGAASIFARSRALRLLPEARAYGTIFLADGLWGLAAILWLGTGVWRAFGGLEKGTAYYLSHPIFWVKVALFTLIALMEIKPAVTLVRWRRIRRQGEIPDPAPAEALARIGDVQFLLVLVVVFLATAMARGILA